MVAGGTATWPVHADNRLRTDPTTLAPYRPSVFSPAPRDKLHHYSGPSEDRDNHNSVVQPNRRGLPWPVVVACRDHLSHRQKQG